MKKTLSGIILITLLSGCVSNAPLRESERGNLTYYRSPEYIVTNANYMGEDAVRVERFIFSDMGKTNDQAVIYVEDLEFTDGIIEMDISADNADFAYLGFAFRIQDKHHYETVYFRPIQNTIQYMPCLSHYFDWGKYEGPLYNDSANIPKKDWFHIRAVIEGSEITLYLNDNPEPVKYHNNLEPTLEKGSVGFWLGNSPKGYFANLIITDLEGNMLYQL